MGPHVIRTTNAARTWTMAAPIVKGCGNVGILQSAPQNAVRVFRWVFNQQNLDDAVGTANIIVDMLAGYRHPNLFVEVWNEAHPTLAQLRAVTDLLHAQGLRVAGGSWATGTYNADDWAIARAVLDPKVDAIAVHDYWNPGALDIWEAYRYREFWQEGDAPVIVTECGRRHGNNTVAELVQYATETAKDSYVLGVTPFSSGATQDWIDQGFDIDAITPQLMAALGGQPVPNPTPTHPSLWTPLVDLSNNNGTVDVGLLARAYPAALFKASEGTFFTDWTFGPNWYAAGQAGMTRGAYHFARPSANSGHAEAQYFLGLLTTNGVNSGDFFALDLEDDQVPPSADLLAYTLDYLRTVYGALGVRPWLYSRLDYLQAHNLLGNAELAQYGIWLADWQTHTPPTAPAPWPFWTAWQYASGPVPGVSGAVDLSYFNGTLAQLRAYGKP